MLLENPSSGMSRDDFLTHVAQADMGSALFESPTRGCLEVSILEGIVDGNNKFNSPNQPRALRLRLGTGTLFTGYMQIARSACYTMVFVQVESDVYIRVAAIGKCQLFCGNLNAGIQAYNVRHFNRMERLNRATFLLDFTLASMPGGLQAEVAEENEQATVGNHTAETEGMEHLAKRDARKRKIREGAVTPLSKKPASQEQKPSKSVFKSGKKKTGLGGSGA